MKKNIFMAAWCLLGAVCVQAEVVYIYAPGWNIPVYFDATGVTAELAHHTITVQQVSHASQIPAGQPALFFDIDLASLPFYAARTGSRSALFLWEPPSVKPHNYDKQYHKYFDQIYTWHDGLVDNSHYYKFYYPVRHDMKRAADNFDAKKLCVMITACKTSGHPHQLYTERARAVRFFEQKHPQDFDLFGFDWPQHITVYKGTVADKLEKVSHYKFSIAYENITNEPGYVTEKIFDCFSAGTIPIYWGAPNIGMYVPADCFIDRRQFSCNEDLYAYLTTMSKETHHDYLCNIERFLASDSAHYFSNEYFAQLVAKACYDLLI